MEFRAKLEFSNAFETSNIRKNMFDEDTGVTERTMDSCSDCCDSPSSSEAGEVMNRFHDEISTGEKRDSSSTSSTDPMDASDVEMQVVVSLTDPMDASDVERPIVVEKTEKLVRNTKVVSFSHIQIREHGVCIGDNPAGRKGVPLSIEWDSLNERKFDIDAYEESRPLRRAASQLVIPSSVREMMLRNGGYSRKEIQQATKSVNLIRIARRRTDESYLLHPLEELVEKCIRGTLNATFKRSKKVEQKKELMSLMKKDKMRMDQGCT